LQKCPDQATIREGKADPPGKIGSMWGGGDQTGGVKGTKGEAEGAYKSSGEKKPEVPATPTSFA